MNDLVLETQDLRHLSWTKARKSSGTAGSFLKSYDDTGDIKIYYKLSDYDVLNGIVGHECINEIIAQRLLTVLGIKHLAYTLVHAVIVLDGREEETYLCRSLDFKERGESKLPIEDFYAMERRENETPMDFCVRMGWEEYIYAMLTVDFLIMNRDRHGANIEVLLSRKWRSVRLAPLFDHGFSMVCRCRTPKEIEDFDVMQDVRVQSFVGSSSLFENLALIPKEYIKTLPTLDKDAIKSCFLGLTDIMGREYTDKISEMLHKRWEYLESI